MNITNSIKGQLGQLLGSNGLPYWRALSDFLCGKVSRTEFDATVRAWISTPQIVYLHNALLMSLLSTARADPTFDLPGSTSLNGTGAPGAHSARKKRKLLPHQDHPAKLRKWTMGIRKGERERLRALNAAGWSPSPLALAEGDVGLDRAVTLRAEGKNPAGTRVPVSLSTTTRTLPSHQNLTERISLIASQHNLTATRPVASLATAAVEAFVKQLAMHALTLTSSSHPFTSISPASTASQYHPTNLTLSSFSSLLTVVPFSVPAPSAAVDRLFLAGSGGQPPEARNLVEESTEAGLDEDLAQYWALLSSRSGVRDFLAGTSV